jgi:Phytanoyl-CoA dioxygenase (PhyH)
MSDVAIGKVAAAVGTAHYGRDETAAARAEDFARNGFASIPALTTTQDIELIRSLLDPLFERFATLGDRAVDLAGPLEPGAPLRSPEINEALILEPRLRNTLAYARCREIARQLLGVPVGYQFDHAIFKPPHNQTPTPWHQDEAYSKEPIPLRSAHFWIPLQAATEKNGCMWFIPGSNQGGVLPHRLVNKRLNGANRPTGGGTLAADNVDTSNAIACPLAPGGATVHHPLTLHYTGANQSDGYRKVWILHFGAYGWLRRRLHPKVLVSRLRHLSAIRPRED